MTNKYIITNCPVCYDDIKMCGATLKLDPYTKESTWINCKDCTDCLLKQIVEKCKPHLEICKNCDSDDCFECEHLMAGELVNKILSMLEIQECENE